jgi:hypothetical protein
MNLPNVLKDPHTYLVIAMFLIAGWSTISGQVPASIATPISGIIGLIAIYVHQTS